MQVQIQMLTTKTESCFFCVRTIGKPGNFHCEEISFDPLYVEELVSKATVFFNEVIAPELITGSIKLQMQKEEVWPCIVLIGSCWIFGVINFF